MIKIKDSDGTIYTSDMSNDNKHSILSINFCTSYTQIEVQDLIENEVGKIIGKTKEIILDINTDYWPDMIAIQGCERGEWVDD